MSDTDSFINEVTEEVRRDRLFVFLRRWWWVAVLLVLLVVGGAAFNEWRKARETAQAQAFGDALVAGIEAQDGGSALVQVETDGPAQAAIRANIAAAAAIEAGETETALDQLGAAATQEGVPAIYADLTALKQALALPPETPAETRLAAFEALTVPGAPFRQLAQEQMALVMIETAQTEEAIVLLRDILNGAGVTPGLQRRARELIVALGGDLSAG